MKVTVRELSESMGPLRQLGQQPMKAQTAYRISKIMVAIGRELEPFDKTREKIMEEMGGRVNGQFIVFSDDPEENQEKVKEFMEALDPVLDEEVNLGGVQLLSVKKLGSVDIQPNVLLALDWLLED